MSFPADPVSVFKSQPRIWVTSKKASMKSYLTCLLVRSMDVRVAGYNRDPFKSTDLCTSPAPGSP